MLKLYRTDDTKVNELEEFMPECWIDLCAPTKAELDRVVKMTGVDADFLRASLDEEERSRIETEDGQTLILVDTPVIETGENGHE